MQNPFFIGATKFTVILHQFPCKWHNILMTVLKIAPFFWQVFKTFSPGQILSSWGAGMIHTGAEMICLGRRRHGETAYLLPSVCVWMGFSSWPDLNLSDIQHNHSPHAKAHSTWESSQDSSGAGIQSLVHVVGLHFLKNAQQRLSEVPVCAGRDQPHEYFTSKKKKPQDAKKPRMGPQQIIYTICCQACPGSQSWMVRRNRSAGNRGIYCRFVYAP